MNENSLVLAFVKRRPKSITATIAGVIGPAPTAALISAFAGRTIHLPSLKTQRNLALPEIVAEHTAGLTGQAKQKVLAELAKAYGMKRWQLVKLSKRH
jgi:hypothetical protein